MLVAGSANMDIVVRASRAPGPGETVLGRGYALYHGGKGANQAVAASRAGARTAFAGCLGRDAHGDALAAALAAEGIDLALTHRVAAPTGVALITVEDDGENRIVVVPGANHVFGPEHLPARLESGTVLLVQLEIPIETVLAAAAKMREAGGITILNASPVAAIPAETRLALLDAADIVLVNETEAAALLGIGSLVDALEAARRLAHGRRAAVVTLGAQGVAWAESGGGGGQMPAHQVAVVDTTGAGDAFAGAFACAVERDASLEEAVRYGNAAGALAATRSGAQPSLPDRAAIVAFLERSS